MTTQLMYDAVDPGNIPVSATLVAGYTDGHYANLDQMRARFPHAAIVKITVFASDNTGDVLDVEQGDATPDQAPGWVARRRATGHPAPCVYTSLDQWGACIAAFRTAGVADPLWWIANWDDHGILDTGMWAKQYSSNNSYDLSIVAGPWPGLQTPEDHVTPQDIAAIADAVAQRITGGPVRDALAYADLWWLDHALAGTTTAAMSSAQAGLVQDIHRLINQLALLGDKPTGGAATDGGAA